MTIKERLIKYKGKIDRHEIKTDLLRLLTFYANKTDEEIREIKRKQQIIYRNKNREYYNTRQKRYNKTYRDKKNRQALK